ncbi:MAG: alpha/beta hydrolase [Gemmatimonadota bacterium]
MPKHLPRRLRGAHPFVVMATLPVLAAAACSDAPTAAPDAVSSETLEAAGPPSDVSLHLDDIVLRPGVSADLHVRLYVNEALPCRDPKRTALAIHGVNHTAASWETFAEAFFTGSRGRHGQQLCQIAALDHVGHGLSGLPEGDLLFGEVTIQDYARSVVGVLDRLFRRGLRPAIIMAHSQGTLTIQTVQQMLANEGTSLARRFRVRDVVLLGTQGPAEAPNQIPPGTDQLLFSLITATPERGTFVLGPPPVFQALWFSNLTNVLSSRAPTVGEIAARGWASDVPLFAILQNVELDPSIDPFPRPSVSAGVFGPGSGTRLQMVDFADDPFSLTPDAEEAYRHLTGDNTLSGFVTLTDPANEAIHDFPITDPALVRAAIDLPR